MAAPPGHTLFTGGFRALEERFLDEVRALKRDDPLRPVDVLVGSNLLGVYLRRRAAGALGGIANLRFLTFLDLARERAPGPDPRPPMPPLGEDLLARRTLRENPAGASFGDLGLSPAGDLNLDFQAPVSLAPGARDAPAHRIVEPVPGAPTASQH